MKILFVRHGESIDDIEDRYGGLADFDLTEKGRLQVSETAEKISLLNTDFEIVLASPLKRAFQTAEIITGQLNLNLAVLEYLRERNLNGILTGLARNEAKTKYPKLVEAHSNWEYVDGSERTQDFDKRVKNACYYLLGTNYNSMIVVTHGLFIKSFFKETMDVGVAKVGDGGFALVEVENKNFKVLKMDGIELG